MPDSSLCSQGLKKSLKHRKGWKICGYIESGPRTGKGYLARAKNTGAGQY